MGRRFNNILFLPLGLSNKGRCVDSLNEYSEHLTNNTSLVLVVPLRYDWSIVVSFFGLKIRLNFVPYNAPYAIFLINIRIRSHRSVFFLF